MSKDRRTDAAGPARLYVPDLASGGEEIPLPEGEAHHAGNVLRLREGAAVELFDGRGSVAGGQICAARRREVRVALEEAPRYVERTGPVIHLAFAVPKGKRLDWLLEKATELGAASLTPVVFARSVAGGDELPPAKRQRWEGHCIAAAKQSGLNHLPEIGPMRKLSELLEDLGEVPTLLGDAGPDARSVLEVAAGLRPAGQVRLVVGPEGGLRDAECGLAIEKGATPARLGATILRIETAAVGLLAALTALLAGEGDA